MDELHLSVQKMFQGLGMTAANKKRRSAIASGLMIATVDPNYTAGSGRPKLKFDGASSIGSTLYPYLSSYTPAASDRVIVAVFSHSMCILGKIE